MNAVLPGAIFRGHWNPSRDADRRSFRDLEGRVCAGASVERVFTQRGQVLQATNGCFTATKHVEPRLGCRAPSENLERQLRVGPVSSPASAVQPANLNGSSTIDRSKPRAAARDPKLTWVLENSLTNTGRRLPRNNSAHPTA